MRYYRYTKQGKKSVVGDQFSRPVRVIQGREEQWLGKSKEELTELQREERRWNEMVDFLEGGQVPRSKYPKATLDQFTQENVVLYLN